MTWLAIGMALNPPAHHESISKVREGTTGTLRKQTGNHLHLQFISIAYGGVEVVGKDFFATIGN